MDGRIYIKPFETTLAGYKTKIEGSNGFDQTIDYVINLNIPVDKLPSQATSVVKGLVAQANSKGIPASIGENVSVNVLMGGTVDKPVINTGLKETAGKMVDSVKEKAKEELEKKKKELEDKVNAEKERLKKEAEDKVNAEKERLRKEVEQKAAEEKEKLKKQAGDKLKDIFKKPK